MASEDTKGSDEAADFGCEHYKRKCKLKANCCGKFYTCRFCHNEDPESTCPHEMDRTETVEVRCDQCGSVQPIQQTCETCDTTFGSYYCEKCRMFDFRDKGQWHCEGCGICRAGGEENFTHCGPCRVCYGKEIFSTHKGPPGTVDVDPTEWELPSPLASHVCRECFIAMNKTQYKCPICSKAYVDMSDAYKPEEYRNTFNQILCNDCNRKSNCKFHVLGHKCGHCSSYNTTVIEGPFDGIENAPPLPESDRVHLEEMAADEPEDELWEDIEGEDD